jgi:hypothetical protein
MRFKKLLASGAVALAAFGSVAGITAASSANPSQNKPAEAVSTSDPDTTQSGDQTAPDTGAEATGEAPESAGEAPESGTESGPSDGPGGHEDPAGQNVDHQFEGQE